MSYGAPHASGNGGGGASSDPAAALRGASLAFAKKKPPAPPPPSKNNNGALAAATLSSQNTGGSVNGLPDMDSAAARNIVAGRLQQLAATTGQQHGQQYGSHLQTPPRVDPKSTSFIAATLAASRNGSPSPPKPVLTPTASPAPRRKASVGAMSAVSSVDVAVDSEPIPTTGSLISIFEGGRGGGGDPVKKTPTRGKRSVDETSAFRREPLDRQDEVASPRSVEKRLFKEPKNQATPPRLTNLVSQDKSDARTDPVPRSSPSPPRQRQRAPQSAGAVELSTPEAKASRSPPRLKNLVSQDTSDRTRPELKEMRTSPTHSPVQAGVPRITNKYNSPQMSPLTPPPQSAVILPFQPDDVKPLPKPKRAPTQTARPPTPPEPRASAPKPKPKPSVESLSAGASSKQRPVPAAPIREDAGPISKPVVKSSAPPTPPKPRKHQSSSNLKQDSGPDDQRRPPPSKPKSERGQAPAPPKPRGSSRPLPQGSSHRDTDSPEPIGLHRTKTTDTIDSANEIFVSAPTSPEIVMTTPILTTPVLPPRHRKTASGPPSPTRAGVQRPRSHTASSTNKNQALDSLASAIMAGSLAAARLTPHSTGTSLPPPVTPIRQKSPRLRQTLRGPVDSSDDEDERHKKNHRPKLRSGKHHAHHEGSRKRWRDEVTPRERKRYEAVWASNRGILLPHAASPSASSLSSGGKDNAKDYSHSVANVVVREVWKRSRLPEDELIEVWDLVDRDKRGMLSRQEFVVGMWLLDQRLKGRKIPTKVSESVWGSASGNGLLAARPKGK